MIALQFHDGRAHRFTRVALSQCLLLGTVRGRCRCGRVGGGREGRAKRGEWDSRSDMRCAGMVQLWGPDGRWYGGWLG
eukprot:scaffold42367_cov61-Phaeocystis_antarctica.AAC.2